MDLYKIMVRCFVAGALVTLSAWSFAHACQLASEPGGELPSHIHQTAEPRDAP
jgi:hypothetical protein